MIENGYTVKDVNAALAYNQRKSSPTYEKNDEHDAFCVATVLINKLGKLPDAKPEDSYWTISQLVSRCDALVNDGNSLEMPYTNRSRKPIRAIENITGETALALPMPWAIPMGSPTIR